MNTVKFWRGGSGSQIEILMKIYKNKVGIKDFIPYLLKISSHQWKKSSHSIKEFIHYINQIPVLSYQSRSQSRPPPSYLDDFFHWWDDIFNRYGMKSLIPTGGFNLSLLLQALFVLRGSKNGQFRKFFHLFLRK